MNIKEEYYPTYQSRNNFLKSLRKSRDMKGRNICILGCGGMGKITLYWLDYFFKNINVTIFDKEKEKLDFAIKFFPKAKAVNIEIVESNYKKLLGFLKKGDLLVDAAYNVDTNCLYDLCNDNEVLYLNSAVESWDYQDIKSPLHYTLYWRSQKLNSVMKKSATKTNFIVSMDVIQGM